MSAVAVKEWWTARELAQLGLPALPSTDRAIQIRAGREDWRARDRAGRGGGREYHVSALPVPARKALARLALDDPGAGHPMPALRAPAAESSADLKAWQRQAMDARARILAEADRLSAAGGVSRSAAVELIVEQARVHALPAELAAEIPAANCKTGAKKGQDGRRTLSRSTVLGWLKARDEAGVLALAPRAGGKSHPAVPNWAPVLMKLYARPQKPSLASCLEDLPRIAPAGTALPSYDQAKRFLRSMSKVDRNRGRMGPRELKSLQAFVTRDFSDLWPTAIYVADGHTFDAEVAHPRHGRPFRPEVTIAIDVATRRIVGWSVALSESTWSVADAMRHAFQTSGVPAIWYVDRGSGFNNAAMDDPSTGFITRLGVRKTNSLPYNSQARGVVERAHQSCLVRAAKKLPTYMGAAMDREAKLRAFKVTRQDIKLYGQSRLLLPFQAFLAYIAEEIAAYNDRRHSTLSMTPNEAWAKRLVDQPDTVIDRLTEAESSDSFRPYEERIARRGQIELWGGIYFLRALEHLGGERVRVGYDLHDTARVWVRDQADRLIGIAELDGNKRPWMPHLTRSEQIQAVRTTGRLARIDAQRAEILEELNGPAQVIEARPHTTAPPEFLEAARVRLGVDDAEASDSVSEPEPEKAANDPVPAPVVSIAPARPVFRDDVEWAAWVVANPGLATAKDRRCLAEDLASLSFRNVLEIRGVDVAALEALCREPEPVTREEVA